MCFAYTAVAPNGIIQEQLFSGCLPIELCEYMLLITYADCPKLEIALAKSFFFEEGLSAKNVIVFVLLFNLE